MDVTQRHPTSQQALSRHNGETPDHIGTGVIGLIVIYPQCALLGLDRVWPRGFPNSRIWDSTRICPGKISQRLGWLLLRRRRRFELETQQKAQLGWSYLPGHASLVKTSRSLGHSLYVSLCTFYFCVAGCWPCFFSFSLLLLECAYDYYVWCSVIKHSPTLPTYLLSSLWPMYEFVAFHILKIRPYS